MHQPGARVRGGVSHVGPMSKAYKACPGPTRRLIPQAGVRLKRPVDASAPVTDRLRPLHEIDNGWDGSREEAGSAGGRPRNYGKKGKRHEDERTITPACAVGRDRACAAAAARRRRAIPHRRPADQHTGQRRRHEQCLLLSATIAGVKAEIECPEDTSRQNRSRRTWTATLTLKNAKRQNPPNAPCGNTRNQTKRQTDWHRTRSRIRTSSPEGNFFEVSITGSERAIKGTYKITGAQGCELPKAEEELVDTKSPARR